MILELVCQHCDSLMGSGARFCNRCGASSLTSLLRSPEVEPGYRLYQDAWHGFATLVPDGWSVRGARGSGAVFVSSGGKEEMELDLLPSQTMMSAAEYISLFLRSLPQHQASLAQDSTAEHARALFDGPLWSGVVSVHLTVGGGTLAIARRRPDSTVDLEPAFARMLSALSPIRPIPRQRWAETSEEAFDIDCPTGWQVQARIGGGGQGMRQPTCRLSADPGGQIFVTVEGQFRNFVHGSPPGGGFFPGMMGGGMMGDIACPFHGLWPAVEMVFWPHWRQQFPGSRLLSYQDEPEGEDVRASVQLLLPGDLVLTYLLVGMPFPDSGMGGARRWMGGHIAYYQAPAALMEKFSPILRGVADSFQQRAAWKQRELGVATSQHQITMGSLHQTGLQQIANSQLLHQGRMDDIAATGHANSQIHATRQEVAGMQMQGWQNSQESSDYVQRGSINGINERADFLNPDNGQVHNLSHHYNNYWDTGKDLVVGSNLSLQPPPDWTPLQVWAGRPGH